MPRLAPLLLFLSAACASAQPGLVWEQVGSLPNDSEFAYAIDHDGGFLAAGSGPADTFERAFYRLPPPLGPSSEWEFFAPDANSTPDWILPLGGDTLIVEDRNRFYRSTDRGQTWGERGLAYGNASRSVTVVPQGVPYAGRILVASYTSKAAYSDDRGATWVLPEPQETAWRDSIYIERIAVVTAGPQAGRLVGAGQWGLTTSDDGGHTWQKTAGEWRFFRLSTECVGVLRGQAPGGGDRVLSVLNDVGVPTDSVYVTLSDDGGETWRRTASLSYVSFPSCVEVVDLGGGRAVAVMKRGPLWGTEDGGETWAEWAPSPTPNEAGHFARWALAGPDGRLYVGIVKSGGNESVFDVRTTVPVVAVANEAPPEASGAVLRVSPNPAGGLVRIEMEGTRTPEAVEIVIVDARGREVARASGAPGSWSGAGAGGVEVSTAGWAPGTYVTRAVVSGQVAVSTRFTVVR